MLSKNNYQLLLESFICVKICVLQCTVYYDFENLLYLFI